MEESWQELGLVAQTFKNLFLASQILFESEINAGVIMNDWNILIYTVKSMGLPAH